VLVGVLFWTYIAGAASAAAMSLVENQQLITKTYFPRVLLPVAAIAPALVELAIGIAILLIVVAVYAWPVSPAIILLPLWVAAAIATALSVGILL
jgi:lipopolysaccharide transport system permease protein